LRERFQPTPRALGFLSVFVLETHFAPVVSQRLRSFPQRATWICTAEA
jgi:hypothetical protein